MECNIWVDYIRPVFFLFRLLVLSLYDVHSNEWSSSLLSLLIMHRVHCQAESQQTLRDLRLQFAEQISLLATKKKGSDVIETLFRGACACVWVQNLTPKHVPAFILFFFCSSALILSDNRIESLIQKADQVLSSLSHRAEGELCPGGSAESTTPPATPGSPSSSLTFSFHSSFTHLSFCARGRWTLLRGEVKSSLINFFTELTSSSFFFNQILFSETCRYSEEMNSH